jgi:hypothetical protein
MATRQTMFVITLIAGVAAPLQAQSNVDPGGRLFRAHLTSLAAAVDSPTPRHRVAVRRRAAVDTGQTLEIYGFAQADLIYEFGQSDPNWFDANRPTKLPAFEGQYGRDNRFWASVRQSRLGAKGTLPTSHGPVKAQFDFDMYGVGVDAGQTTIRLRNAWGQWGQFGAGQRDSPFMDGDVFPNIVEYWGPSGMMFFRNVQLFWQPVNHDNTKFTLAIERPGASGDAGVYADRVELQNIVARFPAPDVSAEWRLGGRWGYVELAGIVRSIHWDDVLADTFDLSGSATGWGANLSSNIRAGTHDVFRLQTMYGAGVENYFNDAPVDIGVEHNDDPHRPVVGKALPDLGISAYLDHTWSSTWSTALGWSMVNIENSDAQAADAYHQGHYASVNALYTPVRNVLMGAEFQWAHRQNFSDGFSINDYRLQMSFKYSFSKAFTGGGN